MGHGPDNRLAGQKILQMSCYLLHHKGGCRAGNIYLCAEEPAKQARVDVVAACGDVTRMVDRSMALIAINSPGEVVDGVYMKRREQQHRHIDQQENPGKHLLPVCDAVMC